MAIEKEIVIVANTKKANDNIESVDDSLKDVNKSTEGVNSSLDKMSGGALSAFGNLKKGVSSAITSFKNLKFAIAATGIGLLVIGILAVKQAFTDSEEGQNKFAKLMGVIGSVTGNFIDLLATLGEKIISAFENPKKALSDFGDLIKNNLITRFEGLINLIPSIGKAISKLFKGDFSGAAEIAINAVGKVALGVESVTESTKELIKVTKEFSKELEKDAKSAAEIADKRAKADKIERDLIVERAKANRDIADLREKAADKENFSSKERIDFLKEAGEINEDITNKEIEAAKLRRDAIIAENQLNKSNKEDLQNEEQAKARVIELDTQRLNLQKRLTAEITSATREKTEGEGDSEIKRLEELQKIRDDFSKKIEDQAADTELKKIDLEQQRALEELDRLKATEEQKLEVIKFFDNKRLEVTNKANDKNLVSDEDLYDGKKNLVNDSLSLLSKASEESKTIQAGQALANTWQGVTEVWSSKSVLPEPIATAQKIASTGLVLASGLNAVKNIGASGGSTSQTTAPTQNSAPSFNVVQGTASNQIAQSVGDLSERPIKTYVLSSDVTTQQELDRNIDDESSI